ncbi:hypothetical protein [Salinibius halmophilus]|uniref:hypothetical protein n=1 Tax=Salinibius halmophilus TaxID=1853216 RepID=UPI000E660E55|nr:hypothetical protein [Salinibius halmophilus]
MFNSLILASIVLINPMLPSKGEPVSPEPQPVQQATPPIRYPTLTDIYIVGERKRAMLNGRWVSKNEYVSGWQLAEVWPDRIRIIRQSQEKILLLEQQDSSIFTPSQETR